jgi:hypothetical protein
MRLRHELVYDSPPDRVFAMLADPAFREAACAMQDVISAEVTLERAGDGFTLTIDQQQRTDDLPSFATDFAGDATQAVQRDEWPGASGGSLRVDAPGTPSSVAGSITLSPEGAGTREVVELEPRIKIPLIGGRLERVLAERITAGMDAEHEVGAAYLAERN